MIVPARPSVGRVERRVSELLAQTSRARVLVPPARAGKGWAPNAPTRGRAFALMLRALADAFACASLSLCHPGEPYQLLLQYYRLLIHHSMLFSHAEPAQAIATARSAHAANCAGCTRPA
jgi:hypothetical protein